MRNCKCGLFLSFPCGSLSRRGRGRSKVSIVAEEATAMGAEATGVEVMDAEATGVEAATDRM